MENNKKSIYFIKQIKLSISINKTTKNQFNPFIRLLVVFHFLKRYFFFKKIGLDQKPDDMIQKMGKIFFWSTFGPNWPKNLNFLEL